jgi:hypothetical protein
MMGGCATRYAWLYRVLEAIVVGPDPYDLGNDRTTDGRGWTGVCC